ncbi:MAG: SDR family NAD(P)-dependent oxidoreductase [Clostridia bacterium]|nr:SDR family NAD(P)-dependent oxidoreductase [Clostridia bacterium]
MKKVILITGAAKGIGRGIVEELSKNGENIIIVNYNNSKREAIELKEKIEKNIEIYKADITNRIEVENMINYIIDKYEKIDVLINNAGISQIKMFNDITEEDWNYMITTNLTSAFFTTKAVANNMIHNKNGCIINISSIWGIVGGSCEVHYSASKAGLIGMSKALAKELGPSNIRVNVIAPGDIDTDMNNNLSEKSIEIIKEETPLGKIGKPIDIARCVRWLIEDEFTTGQVISPNGGWVI